ncbi:MAG: hypothetical protein N2C14_29140, partial [Planctomycetales bacterium]
KAMVKALAKKPDQRFASAEEFMLLLETGPDDFPSYCPTDSIQDRMKSRSLSAIQEPGLKPSAILGLVLGSLVLVLTAIALTLLMLTT